MPRIPLRTEPYSSPTHQHRHFRSKRDLLLKSLSKSSFINGSEFFVLFITARGDIETYASEILGARKEEIWREDVVEGLRGQVVREGERRRAALIEQGKGGQVNQRGGPLDVLMSAKKKKKEQRAREMEEMGGGVKSLGEQPNSERNGDDADALQAFTNDSGPEDHEDPERTMVEPGNDSDDSDNGDEDDPDDSGDFVPFEQAQASTPSTNGLQPPVSVPGSASVTPLLNSVDEFLPSQLPAPMTTPGVMRKKAMIGSAFKTPGKFGEYLGASSPSNGFGAQGMIGYPPYGQQSTPNPSQRPTHTLHMPYTKEASTQYYVSRFMLLQQSTCKLVVKTWIKVLEPKKQTRYPYNAGDEGRPPWWPVNVRHREPDHLLKGERIDLLIAILRCPLIASSRLELATAEVSTHIQAGKMKILREIYRVRKEEERRESDSETTEKEDGVEEDLVVPLPGSPVAMPTPGLDTFTISTSSPFPPPAPGFSFSAQPTPISQSFARTPLGMTPSYPSDGAVEYAEIGGHYLASTMGATPATAESMAAERKRKSDALSEGSKGNVLHPQTSIGRHRKTPTLSQVAERLEGGQGSVRKRARADSSLSTSGYTAAHQMGVMSTPSRQVASTISPGFATSPLARNGGWGASTSARVGLASPQQAPGTGYQRITIGHLRGPSIGQPFVGGDQARLEGGGMSTMNTSSQHGSPLPPGYQTSASDHYQPAGSPWGPQLYTVSPQPNGPRDEAQRLDGLGMLTVNDPNIVQVPMGRIRSTSSAGNGVAGPSRFSEISLPMPPQTTLVTSSYSTTQTSGYYLPTPNSSQGGFNQAPFYPLDSTSLDTPMIFAQTSASTPGGQFDAYGMPSNYYDAAFNEPAAAAEGFRYVESGTGSGDTDERTGFAWGEASG